MCTQSCTVHIVCRQSIVILMFKRQPLRLAQVKEVSESSTCSICLMSSGLFLFSPCLDMYHGSVDSLVWRWILRCMNLWLVLWTRQDAEYRIWTQISRVHSPVVKAVDCRSAGPWFNSGWTSVHVMTWSSNQIIQMINIMSPITTSNQNDYKKVS